MSDRKTLVEEAAERVRRQQREDRVRPLRPDEDLSWERMERSYDQFDMEHDYD